MKIRDTVAIEGCEEPFKLKKLGKLQNGKIVPSEHVLCGDVAVLPTCETSGLETL